MPFASGVWDAWRDGRGLLIGSSGGLNSRPTALVQSDGIAEWPLVAGTSLIGTLSECSLSGLGYCCFIWAVIAAQSIGNYWHRFAASLG
jgi:hypothetical protein